MVSFEQKSLLANIFPAGVISMIREAKLIHSQK